jgi:hypothetical protein
MANYKSFIADYYYTKEGGVGGTRTHLRGSVSQHLRGGSTESAVMSYLRSKHPGHDIELMSLDWID